MTLPPPEICQRILALHLLLGFPDGQDEKRLELLKLLGECGLGWNSLPEFFADMKVNTVTPLPVVDFNGWKKRCQKVCQLHAAIGSSANDGLVAHKKLIEWVAKQQFTWSTDLPAILAADWIFRNPISASGPASQPSGPEVDVFQLTRMVIEDRVVLSPAALVVATLIVLNTHVYTQFAKVPQLGIIAPTSGCGKTTLLTVLQRLVAQPWASAHANPPAIYRHLRRQPRSTLLLDVSRTKISGAIFHYARSLRLLTTAGAKIWSMTGNRSRLRSVLRSFGRSAVRSAMCRYPTCSMGRRASNG